MKKIICSCILFFVAFSNYSYCKIFSDSSRTDTLKYKNTLVVLPAIGYTPNTNWFFGESGNYLFKLKGADTTTRTSNFNQFFIYTLEKQIITQCDYTLFFNKEKYIFSGEIAFLDFPFVYYGIGNNTSEEGREYVSYNAFKLRQIFSKKIITHLFVRTGYDYFNIFNVKRKENGLLDLIERPAAYDGGVASGIMVGIGYDSRNNVLNSSEGAVLNFKSTFYQKMAGSSFVFQSYTLDVRKYLQLSKTRKDVIAFQGYGIFNYGDVPFILMAKLGGESIMRGYYKGRYRDDHLLTFQTEYRLHVWKSFGIVGFAGVGDVASEINKFNMHNLKYSYGFGLRIKMIKKENLNLRIDYGITKTSKNFYISIAEAF